MERAANLERWKAVKFPDPKLADYDFSEPNKIMKNLWHNFSKEDNFDDFFDLLLGILQRASSSEVLDIIFQHVTVSGNSLLHVAASHGSEGFIQLLCHHFPLLITRKNFQGDNALHLAARAGQLDTIKDLVNQVKTHPEEIELGSLLRMRNDKGNTPLHNAVIKGFREAACFLISEEPEVSYYKNRDDKSPLYLAVESRNEEMLASIIEAISRNLDSKLDLVLPEDEKEGNALHLAASMGFLFGVRLLVSRCPIAATQRNKEGNLPIHVACQKGHIDVVRELLTYWFDPMDFLNEKGQNILHVAAKSGQINIVDEILKTQDLKVLINEKDHDGNTPLHLTDMKGHHEVVRALEKRIDNNEMLKSDGKRQISSSTRKEKEGGLKGKPKPVPSSSDEAEMKSKVGNLLVVAVLVAGATFAGAITLPGGDDQLKCGTLSNLMKAYIFFDMVALNFSVIAAMILSGLSYTGSKDAKIVDIASACIFVSLFSMGLAFTFVLTIIVPERSAFFCVLFVFHFVFGAGQCVYPACLTIMSVNEYLGASSRSLK